MRSSNAVSGSILASIFLLAAYLFSILQIAAAQEIGSPVTRAPIAPKAGVPLNTRALAPARIWQQGDPVRVRDDLEKGGAPPSPKSPPDTNPDALLQRQSEAIVAPLGPQPTIVANFPGINIGSAGGFLPPDISGAVGPSHYIQMVNAVFAIYNKKGQRLVGPSPINSLWQGFGGPCESENAGDPIVRYDHLADRWLVSQFAIRENEQCVAISRGPDPVKSGWFLYAFPTATRDGVKVTPDYPKLSVWPDGYYMGTQRGFPDGGLDVWVFERDKMLAGAAARVVQFPIAAPSLFLLPSDVDGPPPPKGTPNVFIRHVDGEQWGGPDRLELFEFTTNWANPNASTFTKVASLQTVPFDAVLCSDPFNGVCADQPDTDQKLETLPSWMMWRLQYRNFGSHQTLVTNHTVNADGHGRAGIRWYELRKGTGGPWTIFQQGTHSPNRAHRWMGSIAMDAAGKIALGYTVSSKNIFPSVRIATRRPADPAGVMAQGEITLVEGKGSQTHDSARWGDYTSMDVDPVDPCTYWYSNEYYEKTAEAGWATRIVGVKLPVCPAGPVVARGPANRAQPGAGQGARQMAQ